jgi:hypothetical protein
MKMLLARERRLNVSITVIKHNFSWNDFNLNTVEMDQFKLTRHSRLQGREAAEIGTTFESRRLSFQSHAEFTCRCHCWKVLFLILFLCNVHEIMEKRTSCCFPEKVYSSRSYRNNRVWLILKLQFLLPLSDVLLFDHPLWFGFIVGRNGQVPSSSSATHCFTTAAGSVCARIGYRWGHCFAFGLMRSHV